MTTPKVSAITTHVAPEATPIGMPEVRASLSRAFEAELGRAASPKAVGILSAQVALETGSTKAMMNYNFGGIKGAGPSGLTASYGTTEGEGANAHATRDSFRAYRSEDEGAKDYVHVLSTRFGDALSAAERGDSHGFVHSLKSHGYFTGSESDYTRAVDRISGVGSSASGSPANSSVNAIAFGQPTNPSDIDQSDRNSDATLASLSMLSSATPKNDGEKS